MPTGSLLNFLVVALACLALPSDTRCVRVQTNKNTTTTERNMNKQTNYTIRTHKHKYVCVCLSALVSVSAPAPLPVRAPLRVFVRSIRHEGSFPSGCKSFV